ncbi:MAG: hypothetical protein AAF587_25790 [Bacteroidota bacterium]
MNTHHEKSNIVEKMPSSFSVVPEMSSIHSSNQSLPPPPFQLTASNPASQRSRVIQRDKRTDDEKIEASVNSAQLEELLPHLIGGYTKAGELLVPADTPIEVKYQYYKKIAESQGVFSEEPGSFNLISIRGLIMTPEGLKQTSSAAAYKNAWNNYLENPEELKKQYHFSDSKTARNKRRKDIKDLGGEGSYDDINVVIQRGNTLATEGENAELEGNEVMMDGYKVSLIERKTSVDPGTVGDKAGSAHLRDGQYDYRYGDHGTTTYSLGSDRQQTPKKEGDNTLTYVKTRHARAVEKMFGLKKSSSKLEETSRPEDKTRYPALRIDLAKNFGAIWRAQDKKGKQAAGHFTPERILEILNKDKEEEGKEGQKTFEGDDLNYHMGANDGSYSQGCQNIRKDEYKDFIDPFREAKKALGRKKKLSFKYTLIDASKIKWKIQDQKIIPRISDSQRAAQQAFIENTPQELPQVSLPALPRLSTLPPLPSSPASSNQQPTQRKARAIRKYTPFSKPIQRNPTPASAPRKIPAGKLVKESIGAGGVNHADDVTSVYHRLQSLKVISAEEAEDTSEQAVILYIKRYQQQIGYNDPDGNITPGKGTETALLENRVKKQTKEDRAQAKKEFTAKRKMSRNVGHILLNGEVLSVEKKPNELTGKLLRGGTEVGEFEIKGYVYEDEKKRDNLPSSISYTLGDKSGDLISEANEGSFIHLQEDRAMAKASSNWYVVEEMWKWSGEKGSKNRKRVYLRGHKISSKAKLRSRIEKLREKGEVSLSDEEFVALLIVASVETSEKLQTINSYDSDVMSFGFIQLTMAGKLQNLIDENEAIFKKHGIELRRTSETIKYYKGKETKGAGIKGTKDIHELRNPYWAAKFHEAGFDDEIIKAQVVKFKEHFADFKKKELKKGTNSDLASHFSSPEVGGMLMEMYNNRPKWVSSVIDDVLEEFKGKEDVSREDFIKVMKEKMMKAYTDRKDDGAKGGRIVTKGMKSFERNKDLLE